MLNFKRNSIKFILFIIFSTLILCFYINSQDYKDTYDIVYKTVGDRELMMDIQQPLPTGIVRPVIIFLCGNAYGGDKSINRGMFSYALDLATTRGYVAVTVDYSSDQENTNRRPIATFPAQIHDIKTAIRFLKANAVKYDIDPKRIGILGHSSGANLALLAGLTKTSDGLEGSDQYKEYTSTVQAIVNFSGPTDLLLAHNNIADVLDLYMGCKPETNPDLYKKASPISYVWRGGPPVLTIHGEKDRSVFLEQALILDKKMKEVGASHTLIIIKDGGHDFTIDNSVWDFFEKVLKPVK
jgi:acetyl esterase/lipase